MIGLPELSDDRRQVLVTPVYVARCRRVDVGEVGEFLVEVLDLFELANAPCRFDHVVHRAT